MTPERIVHCWALEVKYEFLKLARMPVYFVFTLLFPLMFYLFFGLVMGSKYSGRGTSMATYLVGTYGAFGVMGIALFGFGVGVAVERGLGWFQIKRASPMPPFSYIGAKAAVSMLFSVILIVSLFTMAATLGGVRLAPPQWLLLGITLVLGGLPFCVLGLAIGYIAHANSAPAVVNTLYLPMALCSGLWLPIQVLPEAMRHAAPMLPPYHLAQIALSILGAPSYGSVAGHAAALAAFTVVFAALALIAQTRERETM